MKTDPPLSTKALHKVTNIFSFSISTRRRQENEFFTYSGMLYYQSEPSELGTLGLQT